MTENWRHTHTHTPAADEILQTNTSHTPLHEHLHQHSTNTERVSLVICNISASPKNLSEPFPSIKKIQCDGKIPLTPIKKLYLCVCVCEVKLDSAVTNIWPQHTADGSLREKLTWFSLKIQIHTAPASLQSADRHRNTSASNWDVLRKLTLSV